MKLSTWLISVTSGICLGLIAIAVTNEMNKFKTARPVAAASPLVLPQSLPQSRSMVTAPEFQNIADSRDLPRSSANVQTANWEVTPNVMQDQNVVLCQGWEYSLAPDTKTFCPDPSYAQSNERGIPPARMMRGIDLHTAPDRREPRWRDGDLIPWENFSYGEYIGPYRTPDVEEYRVRIGDQIEFNFFQVREKSKQRYQLNVGDLIQLSSPVDPSLNQPVFSSGNINGMEIMPDGTISLALIGEVRAAGKTVQALETELNDKYLKFVKNPSIVVQVTKSQTPVLDLLDAVDSRFGQGGRARQVTVAPDGTLQLPFIGNIPAIGLSLNELAREVNARLNNRVQGVEVTPVLIQRAPRFIYVLGEVRRAGRFELTGPTTALQAIALAEGFNRRSGNLRQIIVFRRDQNWNLMATKLDLAGAAFGKRPSPSDEIWLRDSDIVLIPPKPIQRLSDAVNLYMNNTVYAFFPQQGVVFNFDDFNSL